MISFFKLNSLLILLITIFFLINCSSYHLYPVNKRHYSELSQIDKSELIKEHNKWRQEVGVSPLRWSNELELVAMDWAKKLSQVYGCKIKHSSNNYGENIFFSTYKSTPKSVVDYWAKERLNYNYFLNKCKAGHVCSHYTQIIWKDTKEFGCAMAVCSRGEEIWVCNYNPPGNIIGIRPY